MEKIGWEHIAALTLNIYFTEVVFIAKQKIEIKIQFVDPNEGKTIEKLLHKMILGKLLSETN